MKSVWWQHYKRTVLSSIYRSVRSTFFTEKVLNVWNELLLWSIVRQNPSKSHFSRRVREKIQIKNWCYISRICPDAPLRPIGTNFGLLVRLVNVINCAKFYRNRLRVLILWGVEVWPFPLDCDVSAVLSHYELHTTHDTIHWRSGKHRILIVDENDRFQSKWKYWKFNKWVKIASITANINAQKSL